jgi:hypothetical protein
MPDAPGEQIKAITSLGKQPASDDTANQCPVCGHTVVGLKPYIRHVGRHLEQLALFSLPPLEGEENSSDGEETDEEDDFSAASGNNSSDKASEKNQQDGTNTESSTGPIIHPRFRSHLLFRSMVASSPVSSPSGSLAFNSGAEDEAASGAGFPWQNHLRPTVESAEPSESSLRAQRSESGSSPILRPSTEPDEEEVTIRVRSATVIRSGNTGVRSQDGGGINIGSRGGIPEIPTQATDINRPSLVDLEYIQGILEDDLVYASVQEPGDETWPPPSSSSLPARGAATDDASGSVNPLGERETGTAGSDSDGRGRARALKEGAVDRSDGRGRARALKGGAVDRSDGGGWARGLRGLADDRSNGKGLRHLYYDHREQPHWRRQPRQPLHHHFYPDEHKSTVQEPANIQEAVEKMQASISEAQPLPTESRLVSFLVKNASRKSFRR